MANRSNPCLTCPSCRHIQCTHSRCMACSCSDPQSIITTRCGHRMCKGCITARLSKMQQDSQCQESSDLLGPCPRCGKALVDPVSLIGYLLTRGATTLPAFGREIRRRLHSGSLAKPTLLRFAINPTTQLLLAPDCESDAIQEDELLTFLGCPSSEQLAQVIEQGNSMEGWAEFLEGEDFPCPLCLEPVVGTADVFKTECFPKPHHYHQSCWNRLSAHLQCSCRICGQLTITHEVSLAVADLFPERDCKGGRGPTMFYHILCRFQLGAGSLPKLHEWCQDPDTRQVFGARQLCAEM